MNLNKTEILYSSNIVTDTQCIVCALVNLCCQIIVGAACLRYARSSPPHLSFVFMSLSRTPLHPSLVSSSATVSFCLQVDRLMELHFKYLEAVQQADKRIEGEKHVSNLSPPIPPSLPLSPVLLPELCLYAEVSY